MSHDLIYRIHFDRNLSKMNEAKGNSNAEEWKFKAKLEHCEIWQNVYDGSVA